MHACRYSDDGSLLVAKRSTTPGLWLSTDEGATFNRTNVGASLLTSTVYQGIAGSPDGQTLVVSSTLASDFLYLSRDRGEREPRSGCRSCCPNCGNRRQQKAGNPSVMLFKATIVPHPALYR